MEGRSGGCRGGRWNGRREKGSEGRSGGGWWMNEWMSDREWRKTSAGNLSQFK